MFLLWVERQEGQWEMVNGHARFLLPITRRISLIRSGFMLALANRLHRSNYDVLHYFGVQTGPRTIRSANVVDAGLDDDARLSETPRLIVHVPKEDEPADELRERLKEYRSLLSLQYILVPEPLRVYVRFERRSEDGRWTTAYAQRPDDVLDLPHLGTSLPIAEAYRDLIEEGQA